MICNLDDFTLSGRCLSQYSPHQTAGFFARNCVVHCFYSYLRISLCGVWIYTVLLCCIWKNHCYDWDLAPQRSNGRTSEQKGIVKFFLGLAGCYSLINFTASWVRPASCHLASCLLFVPSAAGADFASGWRERPACRHWHDRRVLVRPLRRSCSGAGLGGLRGSWCCVRLVGEQVALLLVRIIAQRKGMGRLICCLMSLKPMGFVHCWLPCILHTFYFVPSPAFCSLR